MPVWHEATAKWVEDGKLTLVGVTQEQHADRGRLFAQWKNFDWPILNDPINQLESTAVPILVAIDEHGIVRSLRPSVETFENEFIERDFDDDAASSSVADASGAPGRPDLTALARQAEKENSEQAWRIYGDSLVLWCDRGRIDDAIDAYRRAVRKDPGDAASHFRLGVAYRMRSESANRQPNDFQSAVDAWETALDIDPNHYIYRRRIQQYGPRLTKPYVFYDWVSQARQDILARGETPVELTAEPVGAEIAFPARDFEADSADAVSPDPKGRIHRDTKGLIETEVTVVPPRVRLGETARVHVVFRPNKELKAHWNNESDPLRLWVDVPDGWQVSSRLLAAPQGDQPETTEVRHLDFEVKAPSTAHGTAQLKTYGLYYVCEDAVGTCLFLRNDIAIDIDVAE